MTEGVVGVRACGAAWRACRMPDRRLLHRPPATNKHTYALGGGGGGGRGGRGGRGNTLRRNTKTRHRERGKKTKTIIKKGNKRNNEEEEKKKEKKTTERNEGEETEDEDDKEKDERRKLKNHMIKMMK